MRLSCARQATSGTGSASAGPAGAGEHGRRGPRSGCAGSPLSAFVGDVQVRALVREMDESSTRDYERKAHNLLAQQGRREGWRRRQARAAQSAAGTREALCLRSEGSYRYEALVREMDESSTRDYERMAKNLWRYKADIGLAKAGGAGRAQVVLEALCLRSEGLHRSERSYVRWTRVLRAFTRERRKNLARQGRREGWRPRPVRAALRPPRKPSVCGRRDCTGPSAGT